MQIGIDEGTGDKTCKTLIFIDEQDNHFVLDTLFEEPRAEVDEL